MEFWFYVGSSDDFKRLLSSNNNLKISIFKYFVDFLFLFDLSGDYRFNTTNYKNKYKIFITNPHFIKKV